MITITYEYHCYEPEEFIDGPYTKTFMTEELFNAWVLLMSEHTGPHINVIEKYYHEGDN